MSNRFNKRGQKKYSVMLTPERTEMVQDYLHQAGITLSAYLDGAVLGLYETLKAIENEENLSFQDQNIKVMEAMTDMLKAVRQGCVKE